jgi:hypothetical protein
MRKFLVAGFACAAMIICSAPASAKAIQRDGFSFPSDSKARIVVFRPDVHVGSLGAGGVDSPNADWTATARANMQKAFEAAAESREARLEFLGDPEGENAKLLNDYRGLFQVVSQEILAHGVFVDRFPTKLAPPDAKQTGKRYKLDWTLGEEARRLKDATNADYAMFVYTYDSYGDAGRKAAQILMAGLFGVYMPAGVHTGYAGLVDLNSGDIVWFNADIAVGGDPREADGATKRVSQLMAGFPKRAPATAPAVAAASTIAAK